MTDEPDEPRSELQVREEALAGVRDALAGIQQVPATGIDAEKHDTVREVSDSLRALERSLANEVAQQRGEDDGPD